MNPRLLVLKIHIPAFIKKRKLEELFALVADAFGKETPVLKGRSYPELLKAFALYTSSEAEKQIQTGRDAENIKQKLFENARRLGGKIRKDFRIRGSKDVMAMSRILYRILKIDFKGDLSGDVTIKTCFFSGYYTPPVCRFISSLDEGMVAGLSDGGKLSFLQRITDDKDCCTAILMMPEKEA